MGIGAPAPHPMHPLAIAARRKAAEDAGLDPDSVVCNRACARTRSLLAAPVVVSKRALRSFHLCSAALRLQLHDTQFQVPCCSHQELIHAGGSAGKKAAKA
jgi:hypothetical protein